MDIGHALKDDWHLWQERGSGGLSWGQGVDGHQGQEEGNGVQRDREQEGEEGGMGVPRGEGREVARTGAQEGPKVKPTGAQEEEARREGDGGEERSRDPGRPSLRGEIR